jgi:hypothetical protein
MGRRKKDDIISYAQIVSSSYVPKTDYEKAQTDFSSALDEDGNVKAEKINSTFEFYEADLEEVDDVFD